jgi:hypothetical protein
MCGLEVMYLCISVIDFASFWDFDIIHKYMTSNTQIHDL